jgi:YidC/Oxa1 family membrane protein insertase
MDRNSITGIIIIVVILIGYSFFTKPDREQAAEQQRVADSIRRANQSIAEEAKAYEMTQNKTQSESATEVQNEKGKVANESDLQEEYGVFADRLKGEEEYYILENKQLKLTISKRGGKPYTLQLKEYQTHDSLPLILFHGDSTVFGLEFFADGKSIKTNDLMFEETQGEKYMMADKESKTLVMTLPVDDHGAAIEYVYTLHPDRYFMDVDLRMRNMDAYRTDNVQLKWEIYSPQQERGRQNEENYTSLYYRFFDGDVEKFNARSKKDLQEVNETTKIHWIGFKDQFFSSVLLADKAPFEGGYMSSTKTPNSPYLCKFTAEMAVPYDRSSNFVMPMHFYFGPNSFQNLKRIGFHLQELVTIGGSIIRWINAFIIIPIFNWLNKYISNYGIIILLLTLIIKMALLPLTYRSFISQAKMKVLKPEIDEINKKIPKDKAVERQQATMALYKKAGANPMGGCLPMILQMPILYAMFRFFPTSIELRQEPFLWATDLSTYDSILNLPFTIPMYGDHVSLFTLLMTVSTIVSMKYNGNPTGGDSQIPGMKGMMYMMPVMFMLILNNFSAGLTYYYFLANLITIGQNLLFKQFVDEEALRKKLYAKKAKPTKKSNFQARLEEMAKQRGGNLPKRK